MCVSSEYLQERKETAHILDISHPPKCFTPTLKAYFFGYFTMSRMGIFCILYAPSEGFVPMGGRGKGEGSDGENIASVTTQRYTFPNQTRTSTRLSARF